MTLEESLLSRRDTPEGRAVLEDWLRENGRDLRGSLPIHIKSGYGYGYGGGYGDGYGGGYGDGGYGDGGGYGGGGYGGYGDGDGDGGGYGDGDGGGYGIQKTINKEASMKNGLHIISLPGGYYPYVMVGWLRRVSGDEWEMAEARVIRRFGQDQALAGLAKSGPFKAHGKNPTILLKPSEKPEELHRLLIGRCIPCDEKAWAEECPRPKDWQEE